jgi:hypothetical protein
MYERERERRERGRERERERGIIEWLVRKIKEMYARTKKNEGGRERR